MNRSIVVTAALALSLAAGVHAGTLTKAGAKQGRSYHLSNYEMGCKTCHDRGMRKPPSDSLCQDCHDLEELINQTSNHEKPWKNPHNNMHYGKKVPCIECHGEHQPKQPLCSNCHNFEFNNFKEN
ncbi:cytochrome c3 family protein [Ferrimonas kyonanensis]|uniref:cytochrome c3 family protein n=1 Tax=Ferrimonas kyonanensis TaxID=364763 RepID=UPI00040A82AF|nr:cytochrome c3 family protein [Ferrimonas kyonanensis]